MYYPILSPELEAMFTSARYKFCNLTLFIRLRRKIKNINNISLKFIMLTDNNQIFRNCFVIIYCHLTKVSSQINKCIIFEPNELSITLSTLCSQPLTCCSCLASASSWRSMLSSHCWDEAADRRLDLSTVSCCTCSHTPIHYLLNLNFRIELFF